MKLGFPTRRRSRIRSARPGTWSVYNPLPEALHHYSSELEAVLSATGASTSIKETVNEGLSGAQKARALWSHARSARQLARGDSPVLVTWPLLGWWEVALWANARVPVYLIVHDPKPLRPQLGLNPRLGRLVARLSSKPILLAHSEAAQTDIREQVSGAEVVVLPHPVLPTVHSPAARHRRRRVGVFGQFKDARDTRLLEAIGRLLADAGSEGVIRGRGWPDIAGWDVEDAFLSEADLTYWLREVDAVLLPYKRYYQSGIAIRAIECGTPVIGMRNGFLEELLNPSYAGLVDS